MSRAGVVTVGLSGEGSIQVQRSSGASRTAVRSAQVWSEIQAGEHCHFRQVRTSENGRNAPFVAVQAMLGQIRVSGSAGRMGLLAVVRRVGG